MKDNFEEELNKIFEEIEKQEREEWERKTPEEKIEAYRKDCFYRKFCDMTIEELEEEKRIDKSIADSWRFSKFKNPYYSVEFLDEEVMRINTILKLKKEGMK